MFNAYQVQLLNLIKLMSLYKGDENNNPFLVGESSYVCLLNRCELVSELFIFLSCCIDWKTVINQVYI